MAATKSARPIAVTAGVILMVIAYVLLGFGLFGDLVEFHYDVVPRAEWFKGRKDEALFANLIKMMGNMPIRVIPSQVRSLMGMPDGLIWWLWDEARAGRCGFFAPTAMLLFGLVLPLIKLLAVSYWCLFDGATRRALSLAGTITKWTAVDAVAEALVVAMLLLAGIPAKHCFGYAAYVGYCILSAVAVWLLDGYYDTVPVRSGGSDSLQGPAFKTLSLVELLKKGTIPRWLPVVTFALFASFCALGAIHFSVAAITVNRDDTFRMYIKTVVHEKVSSLGALLMMFAGLSEKQIAEGFADQVPLPHSEATVMEAVQALLLSGHGYTITGSVLLFLCVLLVPLIQAIFATSCAMSPQTSNKGKSAYDHWVFHRLSDIAMLDVFVFGIFIGFLVITSINQLLGGSLKAGFIALVPTVLLWMFHMRLCAALMHVNQLEVTKSTKYDV
eukprot:TRINITY_DN62621_c0_g1_i1.p1 TRINITY_DN62621_c0_g1~~TRINITY_DN62621_c0_g1_i1.p1  ORF type:complete len:466 (-),score=51.83 TRINITY_DN62621_c0_g1_i1:64-1392(-)